jgi:flagellar M-ring protein FliF
MRAILEPQPATAAAAGALGTNATPDGAGAIAGGGIAGDSQPNLIADLTSKLERTPLKRLEQMTDFDEEQAAAILKQWMHGARSA